MTELNPLRINKTRFQGLGFAQIERGLWRFVDMEGNTVIGAHYVRKATP